MDERLKEDTRSEWRDLGFFYDRDDETKSWLLVGSRAGLLRFVDLLRVYSADPRHSRKSEHEHYGPYMYLEVMTWSEAGMDHHAIFGSRDELGHLASVVERHVRDSQPGRSIRIRDEFSSASEYDLVLSVREDDFDPASADPNLSAG